MDPDKVAAIEAILFAYGKPLSLDKIAQTLNITKGEAKDLLKQLEKDYKNKSRGISLYEIAGGYQLMTKPGLECYVKKLCKQNFQYSLSQACLETLAIILYRQPITRAGIEQIRGVSAESALKTLMEKDLVKEIDRLDAPGRPILYGTTSNCLEYLGLNSLDELPEPDEVKVKQLSIK